MTPGRRALDYASFDDIHADVRRLLEGCTTVGSWTLGQILDHLATVTDRVLAAPVDGPHDTSLRVPPERRDEVLASGGEDPQQALEYAGVGTSLANLMTFPFVAERVNAGKLALHGAWFAIAHGELHWRDEQTGAFTVVEA